MTTATDRQVIRRTFDHSLVSYNFIQSFFISLMTGRATVCKMWIGDQNCLVNNEPLVIFLRRNWRRLPCSALPLTFERRNKSD